MGGGAEAVAVPTGFPTPILHDATFSKTGSTYSTDYEPAPFLVEGDPGVTTKYVDVATGSDANPGTSALPYKTAYPASIIAGDVIIKVKGGVYSRANGLQDAIPNCTNLQMQSWDGNPVYLTNNCDLTGASWALDTGTTYKATVPGYTAYGPTVWDASDPDAYGDHKALLPAASLAACRATPGTFFGDSGTLVYVNLHDGRVPDNDVIVYDAWGTPFGFVSTGGFTFERRLYVENFHFEGGGIPARVMAQSTYKITADFKNCSFKYSRLLGAFDVQGLVDVTTFNCVAAKSHLDGFSYLAYGAGLPSAMEINCEARTCGMVAGSLANQGSTMHDGGAIIRVNGNYHHNQSDQIADVNAGTNSWNMGCIGADGLDSGFAGFRCGNGAGGPEMWLDGCTVTGMTYSIACDTGASTLTKDFTGAAGNTGAGTIGTY